MAAGTSRPELIAIVGPTASGKSELAMKLAKSFNGEIIAADSRTIYKDMSIGTAKPPLSDQRKIKHWGLDLVEPGQSYSAASFKAYAEKTIDDIQNKGKLPIIVGGTGLYVDGLLFNFSFVKLRKTHLLLSFYSTAKLQKIILKQGWEMPKNSSNRRHLINTIKRGGQVGSRKHKPLPGALFIGLMPTDEIIRINIAKRAEKMFAIGIIDETRLVLDKYGQKALGNSAGIIYKIVRRVLSGEISDDEAIELVKTADWQYARRQKTWFRRNKFIQWFKSVEQAYQEISSVLNK